MRIAYLPLLAVTAALAQQPQIRFAVNGASFAQPSAANGKLARGSMAAILGSGLGPEEVERAPGSPLPLALGGVTVEITAGGASYQAPIVSVYKAQVNILVPPEAPSGAATLKVTAGSASSQPFAVTIAERGIGIFTLSGTGKGTAILTRQDEARPEEAANSILTPARPGEVWDLWVTGLGGDSSAPVEVLVGGQAAEVQSRGAASCCPGYDRIRFRIPDGVSGCCVPLKVRLENVESNEAAISISGDGESCAGPELTPELLDYYRREGTWKAANLSISRSVQVAAPPAPSTGTISAVGIFSEYSVRGLHRWACIGQAGVAATPGVTTKTIGACTITRVRIELPSAGTAPSEPAPALPVDGISAVRYLDAGAALSVTGSAGAVPVPKSAAPGASQFITYQRSERFTPPQPAAGTPGAGLVAPGRKSFTGPGGPDVAAFTADLDVNESLVWTNATTIEAMQRSQPLQVAWTGGTSGSQVVILGTSSSGFTSFPVESATFQCLAEPQAGSFTVPREVLNEMIPSPAATPVPTGSLGVGTSTVSGARLPGFDQTYVGYTDITSKSVRVF